MEKQLSQWNHSWFNAFEDVLYPFFIQPALSENKKFSQKVPYDVDETDEFYRLSLDIPGIDPKNIRLKVQENTLHISANEDKQNKNMKSHRQISTSFSLPYHVEASKISANVENGVMDIVLPKKKSAQLKEIPVQSNSAHGFFEKVKKQLTQ